MGQAPPAASRARSRSSAAPGYTTRTDIITGPAGRNSGHEANGLAFGPDGRLYIDAGQQTNAGVVNPNHGIFQRPEMPLSGAVLVADIHAGGFNGNITYSPPNTYSERWTSLQATSACTRRAFATRTSMRVPQQWQALLHRQRAECGYGPRSQDCTSVHRNDAAGLDELNLVVAGQLLRPREPQPRPHRPAAVHYHPSTEARERRLHGADRANLPASSDGMAEYTSGEFGGQMQGDLLYVAWVDSQLHRVKLSPDGRRWSTTPR